MSESPPGYDLDGFGGDRRPLTIITPEGVPLTVIIADIAERVAAFGIDFIAILLATLALALPFLALEPATGSGLWPVFTFVIFLVSNLYFIVFELHWRGSTPGKRVTGLRVVSRSGGPLRADALIARNLMREIESLLPLKMLVMSTDQLSIAAPGHVLPLAGWVVLFGVLPLLNSERRRAGDLVGGTLVIALPRQMLLEDLARDRRMLHFTDRQLGYYGERELRVLDDVLRQRKDVASVQLRRDIFERIQRRIGWSEPYDNVDGFLTEFYTAQRAFLERRRVIGKIKLLKG